MADKPNNTPVHTVRIGGVKATIWQNQSQNGTTFYTTTVVQNYKDKDDKWHESNRHFTEDLPKLELAARKAYDFIHSQSLEQVANQDKPKSFQERETKRRSSKSKAAKSEDTGAAI